MKKIILLLIVLVQFVACKENPLDGLVDLDLMKEGVPLKIKAPKDAIVKINDMGLLKDITIETNEQFGIQLMAGSVSSADLKELIAEAKQEVKKDAYFSKIISEDETGFIFEKNIDGKLNYDFRSFRIQGEYEFDFQRSLMGTFSEKDVKLMFEAVK